MSLCCLVGHVTCFTSEVEWTWYVPVLSKIFKKSNKLYMSFLLFFKNSMSQIRAALIRAACNLQLTSNINEEINLCFCKSLRFESIWEFLPQCFQEKTFFPLWRVVGLDSPSLLGLFLVHYVLQRLFILASIAHLFHGPSLIMWNFPFC